MNFWSEFFVPGVLTALAEVFHALFYFFLFIWGIQTISSIACKLIAFWFQSRMNYLLQAQDALLREDVLPATKMAKAVKEVGK